MEKYKRNVFCDSTLCIDKVLIIAKFEFEFFYDIYMKLFWDILTIFKSDSYCCRQSRQTVSSRGKNCCFPPEISDCFTKKAKHFQVLQSLEHRSWLVLSRLIEIVPIFTWLLEEKKQTF